MRKMWVGAGVAVALGMGFVMLLVVGVYLVAGNLAAWRCGRRGQEARQGERARGVPADRAEVGQSLPGHQPRAARRPVVPGERVRPEGPSAATAQGIAQFIPGTWAVHGVDGDGDGDRDVWDPEDAIPSAASYDCSLASYVKSVPGNPTENMLASYNAGPDAVIRYQGVPPYEETRNYVKTITTLEKSFAAPTTRVDPSEQAAGAIAYAQKKLGTLYLWGGNGTPEQGGRFDCSGLTKAAYESVGIKLPRVANDQYNAGPHPGRDELLPGDLVFFSDDLTNSRAIRHVGIYVGGGYMIDAPRTGAVIRFDPIDTPDYFGATRVTEDGAKALPTTV